ncbi:GGDEF domain-containing protein, partial [Rhodobacteraceae bacterium KMM 6894]|nr:GGDEF domain-containing protein [Rhodobacteraceae bacterium KMM 6894]
RSRIQKIADSDPLTGLVNRQAASRLFTKLQGSIDYNKQQIVMYFVDLDNFKSINDLFDHSTGDLLLITLSQRLKALSTESSIVCRLGGDEYVIALVKDLDFDKNTFA